MIVNKKILIGVLLFAILIAGVFFAAVENTNIDQPDPTAVPIVISPVSTTTPLLVSEVVAPPPGAPPTVKVLPYGNVILRVGETAQFKGISVRLLRVFDDSRCAEGVTCIWAGTIKSEVEIISGLGKSASVIELGKEATTEAESVTFILATPYPKAGKAILSGEYQLTFIVQKHLSVVVPPPATSGKCYVGGCSGEICSDRTDIASNCMYQEQFACYKKTTCERQASGECGWTETAELKSCLASPGGIQ